MKYPLLYDEQWLRDQYVNQRRSSAEVGAAAGITNGSAASRVQKALHGFGIPLRPIGESLIKDGLLCDAEWLRARYVDEGKSLEEVAVLAGVPNRNRTTVRRALKRSGIQVRTVSESKKGKPSPRRGIPLADATKAKLSAAKAGKPSTANWSPASRAALAAKRRGSANPMHGSVSPNRGKYFVPDLGQAQRNAALRSKWRKHGLSPEDHAALYESQKGLCAICGQSETRTLRGRVIALAVDHCHATGKIRGLLCHACNVSLGLVKDDTAILRAAIAYLEKHAAS